MLAQRGFTAVELMIAMTIGLLISALVVTVFATSATTYRVSNSLAALQENGRAALAAIERDARVAGFRGCNSNNLLNSGPFINTIASPGNYANALGNMIAGYNANGASWTPALPAGPAFPGIVAGANASDVLVLRIPTGPGIPLTTPMANATAEIPVLSVAGLAANTRMIVADCGGAASFVVSGTTVANTVQHTVGASTNATANLQRAYGEDAVVIPYTTRAYYIGASSSGVAGERSLWVMDGNPGVAEELAENVERFEVLYGEDLNADFVADVFRNANAIVNFNRVVAIQVHLLTRGARNNETLAPTPFQFFGATIVPTDRFMRRVYTSTIQLRNRVI